MEDTNIQLLENQLLGISQNLETRENLLKLEQILSAPVALKLYNKRTCALFNQIGSQFQDSLIKARIYSKIQTILNTSSSCLSVTSKSLLDTKGKFIWWDSSAESVFGVPESELKSSNFFGLLSTESKKRLFKKYGTSVADENKNRVISYFLQNSRALTSRVTFVMYTDYNSQTDLGVLLETRPCNHSMASKPHSVLRPSPKPMFSFCSDKGPFVSPLPQEFLFSPFPNSPHWFKPLNSGQKIEDCSISPFLSTPKPTKKQKVNLEVSDFDLI
mmetsp:Transcript_8594/g.12736  ORF Transcript_8594/g.12736 Transcript_8594/m.12736 type:complete len:273 (-) Transcript_8594:3134-3952(-)